MPVDPGTFIIAIILAVIAVFFVCMIACSVALGRMHAWLKARNEVFGDGNGLVNAIRRRL